MRRNKSIKKKKNKANGKNNKGSLDIQETLAANLITPKPDSDDELQNLINKSDGNSGVKSFTILCTWAKLTKYIKNNLVHEESTD